MKKISKKKIILFILLIIAAGLTAVYLWAAYIFFPDDYEITKSEALQKGPQNDRQKIAYSLIDELNTAEVKNYDKKSILNTLKKIRDGQYYIKNDSFIKGANKDICFRMGTGYPGIWMDERSSILVPDNASISFRLNSENFSELEFSALSLLSDGKAGVEILSAAGKKLRKEMNLEKYTHKHTGPDVAIRYNNTGFPRAKEETGWNEYKIDLSEFSGKSVTVRFSFKGKDGGALFIGNPRVFKKSGSKRYNVIYLIFDGVSTRHFSFYNDDSRLTPYMKEVADREFIVFDNMFTLGNKTRISTVGLFSSIIPLESGHGINRNFIPENTKERYYRGIRLGKYESLPDVFKKNGYITEQFGNSGFTVHLISTGVDYGFERSYEFSYNPYDTYGISHRFFEFLRKNNNREFFAYLHYNSPHKPFFAPPKYFLKGAVNAPLEALWRPDFMGCISYTDDVFKNIYLALKQNGLLENTILVVATDHGAGYNLKKFDMGFHYNDYTRMTFMTRLPEALKQKYNIKAKRINTYVSSINTAPTLVDLCGFAKVNAFDGRSYKKVLTEEFHNDFFDKELWCFGRKSCSVITDDHYKYIFTLQDAKDKIKNKYYFFGSKQELPFEEIYDLKADPEEMNNLIHSRPDKLMKFRNIYTRNDFHHPERTVLSFFNTENKQHQIEVDLKCRSKINDIILYSEDLKKQEESTILTTGDSTKIIFRSKTSPLYLVFKNEEDRSPVSISIKSDGALINKNRIYSTYLNLNYFNNPVVIKENKDFLLLNDTRLPVKSDIMNSEKGLSVKISRMDLHRWIDIGKLEESGISAGMKETLKSWGYIQ
ncbi:MAG: sulfatase-like hydrolase/transferase [Spirochaetes bacterium]|nr:sulfatase-like hydrolase/transferase [Spirochaetota bacterium]